MLQAIIRVLHWLGLTNLAEAEVEFASAPMMMGGVPRSGKWPALEKKFIAEHPVCEVCQRRGAADNPLNAHHIRPYHIAPEAELLESNLICLCRSHHLLYGHLLSWASWNIHVREDAAEWRKKIENRP